MSQHDFVIDNQNAPASRADINNALQALASCSSGTTAPVTTYANMLWYDTANDLLKIRNEANSAWITLGTVDQTNNVFNPNFLPATQAEAEAGTNNVKAMTPLRVAQAIAALSVIADGSITNAKLAANAVTTGKINYATGSQSISSGSGGSSGNVSISPYTTLWTCPSTANPSINGTLAAPTVSWSYGGTGSGTVAWRYIVT
jgi:hypothetical protein